MKALQVVRLAIVVSAAALVACGEPASSTSPAVTTASAKGGNSAEHHSANGTNLLECPVDTSATTSALIGALGGTVSLGGSSVTIPAGALLGNEVVELTIPAGHYMEVDLSVNGGQSIIFQLPVTATIDYSRCGRSSDTLKPLTVWHIDEHTKALLENMGGVDDKLLQQITFTTGHFSGYAVAN